MKSKQTTKSGKLTNASNFSLAIPKEVANREFINALGKRADTGANSHVEKFLLIIDAIIATRPTFTLQDCIYYSLPYELPALEVKALLEKWVSVMEKLGKVSVCAGVYDENLIILS